MFITIKKTCPWQPQELLFPGQQITNEWLNGYLTSVKSLNLGSFLSHTALTLLCHLAKSTKSERYYRWGKLLQASWNEHTVHTQHKTFIFLIFVTLDLKLWGGVTPHGVCDFRSGDGVGQWIILAQNQFYLKNYMDNFMQWQPITRRIT